MGVERWIDEAPMGNVDKDNAVGIKGDTEAALAITRGVSSGRVTTRRGGIFTRIRLSIDELSTSWSPVYTTQMALGYLSCVARIAAQSTRSPPPPALLYNPT